MIAHILLYGAILATLLAAAAHFLDRALCSLGQPTRWVWLLAMAASVFWPLATRFFPAAPPEAGGAAGVVAIEALYEWGAPSIGGGAGAGREVPGGDGPLALLWILTSLALAFLLAWTAHRLRRERRTWKSLDVAGERVLVSRGLGPAVVGILRPRIVLPPWVLSLEEEKLDLVLLHEREHREARDPAVLAGGTLLATAAPLNPALWWMLRRLRLAVERDCDARVLARGIHRKRYGRFLLDAASGALQAHPLSPALVEGGRTFLERRLAMIRHVRKSWPTAIPAILAGAFFLVLACEAPTPPGRLGDQPEAPGTRAPEVTLQGEGMAEPLVYRDGIRVGRGAAAVKTLDPQTIERIEVIKGAQAAALYGEEGADGVILVFTRPGEAAPPEAARKEGPPTVELAVDPPRVALPAVDVPGVDPLKVDPATVDPPGPDDAGPSKALRLRNTLSPGKEPLVLVDGVVVDSETWREEIAPQDIEKIEVIKGPAALALYGERAANGVIIITRKR